MNDSYYNVMPAILRKVKEWTRDAAEDAIELKAYDKEGKLFFKSLDPSVFVTLDATKMILTIRKTGVIYSFAIDYWLYDHGRYVIHTRDGHGICFVDWCQVNGREEDSLLRVRIID